MSHRPLLQQQMLIPKTWACVHKMPYENKYKLECSYEGCGENVNVNWRGDKEYPELNYSDKKQKSTLGYQCVPCKKWFCCFAHKRIFHIANGIDNKHYPHAIKILQATCSKTPVKLNNLYCSTYCISCLRCKERDEKATFEVCKNILYEKCYDCIIEERSKSFEFYTLRQCLVLILLSQDCVFKVIGKDVTKLIIQWCFTKPYVFKLKE